MRKTLKAGAIALWVMFTAINIANISTIQGWPLWYTYGAIGEISISIFIGLTLALKE